MRHARVSSTSLDNTASVVELHTRRPNRQDYSIILQEERESHVAARRRFIRQTLAVYTRNFCRWLSIIALFGGLILYIVWLFIGLTDSVSLASCQVTTANGNETVIDLDDGYSCDSGESYLYNFHYDYDDDDYYNDTNITVDSYDNILWVDNLKLNESFECWFDHDACELLPEYDTKAPKFFYMQPWPFFCVFFLQIILAPFRGCKCSCCDDESAPKRPQLEYSDEAVMNCVLSYWVRIHLPDGYNNIDDVCLSKDIRTIVAAFAVDVNEEDEEEDQSYNEGQVLIAQ